MFERITRREEADLFIAWLAISLAFAIIKIAPYGIMRPLQHVSLVTAVVIFGIALLTVGIGFILHEMAHKYAALHFGYWAEFHKDNSMLLIAVVVASLVGFVFAAPGATVIYTSPYEGRGLTREENGKISAAGPAMNLLLCIPFAALYVLGGGLTATGGDIIAQVGLAGIQINAMIAAFNMIPFGILDGRKVWAWSMPVFTVLIAASFALLVASFSYL
jgi:Zn-dependent protease